MQKTLTKLLSVFILIFAQTNGQAQVIHYADSILNFSSQYNTLNYSAGQVTGAPDVYPNYGDLPNTWASTTADDQREFLELYYSNAMPIDSILIYETYNGGAIDTVYVKNPNTGAWEVVYQGAVDTLSAVNILRIGFPMTSFNVSEIRLAINSPAVPGWNEIDAVAVVNSTALGVAQLVMEIPIVAYPNPVKETTLLDLGAVYSGAVILTDITGRMVEQLSFDNQEKIVLALKQPRGIYFATIIIDHKRTVLKLIKE